MNNFNTKQLIYSWPKWMQDYRLTSNSPKKSDIMFEITNEWLEAHSTIKGGWTKKQAEILCFSWPLTKGWKRKAINNFITNKDRVNFESAAHITCKTKKPDDLTIDRCIEYLFNRGVNDFTSEQKLKIHDLEFSLSYKSKIINQKFNNQ